MKTIATVKVSSVGKRVAWVMALVDWTVYRVDVDGTRTATACDSKDQAVRLRDEWNTNSELPVVRGTQNDLPNVSGDVD